MDDFIRQKPIAVTVAFIHIAVIKRPPGKFFGVVYPYFNTPRVQWIDTDKFPAVHSNVGVCIAIMVAAIFQIRKKLYRRHVLIWLHIEQLHNIMVHNPVFILVHEI